MSGVSGRGADDKGPSRMECSSPRQIITWLLRRMTVRKQVSTRVTTPPRRARETMIDTVVPGNNKTENVVNLGVACSLFYLTMATKTDLEKMMELQRDTQVLLREIKEELRRKNRAQEPFEVVESPTSCLTELRRKNRAGEPSEVVESPTSCLTDAGAMFNCRRLRTPFAFAKEGTVEGDQSGGSGQSTQEGIQEIEKLEVELEAELERLQLRLDSESPSMQGHRHAAKTRTEDSALSSLTAGEVMNLNGTGHSDLRGGVAPVELERKLHELLESRQEERIKELEAAVAYYKHELYKKERSFGGGTPLCFHGTVLKNHRAKSCDYEGCSVEILPH